MSRLTDLYVINQKYRRPNIDTSHRCILKCPQCIRQKKISQDQIRRSFDLSQESLLKILNYYDNHITFCGQISDPIYHPNFLDFLKICDSQKRTVRIATNGSGKSNAWWEEAFSYGVGTHGWYFGVDGIDEKSQLYRVGSNFKDVWKRMKQGRDLGHVIVWQYIIFGYNEHEVDRAIEIAKEEDFSLLLIKTDRMFKFHSEEYRSSIKKIEEPNIINLASNLKKEEYVYESKKYKDWQRKTGHLRNIKK